MASRPGMFIGQDEMAVQNDMLKVVTQTMTPPGVGQIWEPIASKRPPR